MKGFFKNTLWFMFFSFTISFFAQIVGCTNNASFYRPEPNLLISKSGFDRVRLDRIEIEKHYYTIDLLDAIKSELELVDYNLNAIEFKIYKNQIQISASDDLFLNGWYEIIAINSLIPTDKLTAKINITNSKHLADNFNITFLGEVFDYRPKSILTKLLEKNVGSLSLIAEVATQLTNVENFTYYKNDFDEIVGADVVVNNIIPTRKPEKLYGQLHLSFTQSQNPIIPANGWNPTGHKINDLISNINTNLGITTTTDTYTLFMYFITANIDLFLYVSPLVNDLLLENLTPTSLANSNEFEIVFQTKPFKGAIKPSTPVEQNNFLYDNYAHYFNEPGGLTISFTLQ